jgi:hypothetical protein
MKVHHRPRLHQGFRLFCFSNRYTGKHTHRDLIRLD